MQTFPQFTYQRPNIEAFQRATKKITSILNSSEYPIELHQDAVKDFNKWRRQYANAQAISYTRHTIDTTNPFYLEENQFFDEHNPEVSALETQFYHALLNSPQRAKLEEIYGTHLFKVAEMSIRTFSPEVLDDLKEENRLVSQYTQFTAQAQFTFKDTSYNLSSIVPLEADADRQTRQGATRAKWAFFETHATKLDTLFDQLVKVRHRIAQKLGFETFTELAYLRMRRDYTPQMVAQFREEVAQKVVPFASTLYQNQQERLELDTLAFYDENLLFKTGNPQPAGDAEWIIQQADTMYKELSPETHTFFTQMQSRQLMDLLSKDNKAPGGYCTFFPDEKVPFIFSNFNGTSNDVDVLTHEAGHAFQLYCTGSPEVYEYIWPTSDACEIHSMSMEFFTWPWMHLFFKEKSEDYRYGHLVRAIRFLPYGVAVDAFQHEIYANPTMTPQERHDTWRALEAKFLPHRNYDGIPFLEEGGLWQRQAHIFAMPFYYIDYTLAQVCALQFWQRDHDNHPQAWADYLALCRLGGKAAFNELVASVQLKSPFQTGSLDDVLALAKTWTQEAHAH